MSSSCAMLLTFPLILHVYLSPCDLLSSWWTRGAIKCCLNQRLHHLVVTWLPCNFGTYRFCEDICLCDCVMIYPLVRSLESEVYRMKLHHIHLCKYLTIYICWLHIIHDDSRCKITVKFSIEACF